MDNGTLRTIGAFVVGGALASSIALYTGRHGEKPAAVPTQATAPAEAAPPPSALPSAVPPAPASSAVATLPPTEPAPAAPRHQERPQRRPALPKTAQRSTPAASPAPAATATPGATPEPTVAANTPAPATPAETVAPAPPPPKPQTVTIPAGTVLQARLGQTISTKTVRSGDTFSATLDRPLVVDGLVIAERGARVDGRVVDADEGGRVQGVASLEVELTRLATADGQRLNIRTSPFERRAESTHKQDAAKIGGGAALGAVIGAIAGGGKGAAIGAGVGGAGGAGTVLLTRGKPAEIPVETRIPFRLAESVTVTEKLR